MRMWNINPKYMCLKHLCGEHLEHHMFSSALRMGMPMDEYAEEGLIELENIKQRHDELASEIIRRGHKHTSQLEDDFGEHNGGYVDVTRNIQVLKNKCPDCKKLLDRL